MVSLSLLEDGTGLDWVGLEMGLGIGGDQFFWGKEGGKETEREGERVCGRCEGANQVRGQRKCMNIERI